MTPDSYTIALANRQFYTVTVVWSSPAGRTRVSVGNCDAGTLTLDADTRIIMFDTVSTFSAFL